MQRQLSCLLALSVLVVLLSVGVGLFIYLYTQNFFTNIPFLNIGATPTAIVAVPPTELEQVPDPNDISGQAATDVQPTDTPVPPPPPTNTPVQEAAQPDNPIASDIRLNPTPTVISPPASPPPTAQAGQDVITATQTSSSDTSAASLSSGDNTINLRSGPGTDFDIVGRLQPEDTLPIIGRNGNKSWWQVQTDSGPAWASAEFTLASNVSDVPNVTDEPDTTALAALTTSPDSDINLRSGPDTTYDTVGSLSPGTTLLIVGRTADSTWWQVATENGTAWVAAAVSVASNTFSVPVVEVDVPTITEPSVTAAVDSNINLRSQPSLDSDVVGVLLVGFRLTVIGRTSDNSWWQVQTDNGSAWVSDEVTTVSNAENVPVTFDNGLPDTGLLGTTGTITSPTDSVDLTQTITPTTTETETTSTPLAQAGEADVNLLSIPSVTAEVVGLLGAGQSLPIIGRTSDSAWLQVSSDTGPAWLEASLVTTTNLDTVSVVDDATPTPIVASEKPIVILTVNKGEEFVDIQNVTNRVIDLSGWRLVSERGNESCDLRGVIAANEILRVWSSIDDVNEAGGIKCGIPFRIWDPLAVDLAVLFNPDGQIVDEKE